MKTTYGLRCTRSSKGGGFMSMRARKLGTIQGCTLKVSPISLHNSSSQRLIVIIRMGQENVVLHCLLHRRRHGRHSALRA